MVDLIPLDMVQIITGITHKVVSKQAKRTVDIHIAYVYRVAQ